MSSSEPLINPESLQPALIRLADTYGIGCLLLNSKGQITFVYNWSCACADTLYLSSEATLAECVQKRSFYRVDKNHHGTNRAIVRSSANGLSNILCSIYDNNMPIAHVIVGLFFLDPLKIGNLKNKGVKLQRIKLPSCLANDDKAVNLSVESLVKLLTHVELFAEFAGERLGREEAKSNTEVQLHELFNSLPQIVYEADRQGKIVFVNDAGQKAFGYSREEFLCGMDFSDFLDHQDFIRGVTRLENIVSGKTPEPEEFTFRRKDGSLFSAIVSSRLRFERSKILGSRGIIFDITSIKKAEAELRASEQRYRSLFESATDAIVILEKQRISHYNSRAQLLFKQQGQDLVGMQLSDLLQVMVDDPQNTNCLQALNNPSRRKGDSSRYECRFRLANGETIEVEASTKNIETPQQQFTQIIFRDVTEQNRNRKELEEREGLWRAMFERAPLGIILNRMSDSAFLAVNPGFEKITGWSSAEAVGRYFNDFIHPDNLQGFKVFARKLLKQKWMDNQEVMLARKDGSFIRILFSSALFQTENDLCAVSWLIDITESTRLTQEIAQSEAKLRSLFQAVPIGLAIIKDRKVFSINDAFCKIVGYYREQLINQGTRIFYESDEDFMRVGKDLYEHIHHDGASFTETYFRHSDGTRRHALLSAAPLLPGDQEAGVAVAVQDITEQERMTQALRLNEFRFRSFFNTNPMGILLVDFDGIILDANKALLHESGYLLSELIGKSCRFFIAAKDQESVYASIAELKTGLIKSSPLNFTYEAKNGEGIPVRAESWLIVDEKSDPLYIGVFIRNISIELTLAEEKAALEKQIIHAQKSEAIGTLAGGIAHDFNNILGGIIGYIELALNRTPSVLDDKTKGYLNHVLAGGKRAKNLVQQILRFSRNSTMTMEPVHLMPMVKESLQLLRSTLPTTIEIQRNICPESDMILGDPTQIHQVIMNLATNAYHAMRERGGILMVEMSNVTLVSVRRFQSMVIPAGEYLRISIADTGMGIRPDLLSRIFEPYFTTKEVDEGAGLGLAVVLGIIKSHKGLIEVASEVGKGSCFTIHLPVYKGHDPHSEEKEHVIIEGHGEHLLVVDDEPYYLEVVEESLKSLGYHVTATRSSRQALELFSANVARYKLLLTDQTMPEMTGVQLIEQIHNIRPDFPVILCTGYSETVSKKSAKYYKINRFLMKPVSVDELALAISETLAEEKGEMFLSNGLE